MKNKNDLFILFIFLLLNVFAVILWNEWSFPMIGLSIIILGIYFKVVVSHRIELKENHNRTKG